MSFLKKGERDKEDGNGGMEGEKKFKNRWGDLGGPLRLTEKGTRGHHRGLSHVVPKGR